MEFKYKYKYKRGEIKLVKLEVTDQAYFPIKSTCGLCITHRARNVWRVTHINTTTNMHGHLPTLPLAKAALEAIENLYPWDSVKTLEQAKTLSDSKPIKDMKRIINIINKTREPYSDQLEFTIKLMGGLENYVSQTNQTQT